MKICSKTPDHDAGGRNHCGNVQQVQSYTITAQFSGSPDGVYLASASAPVTLLVNPSPGSSTPVATSSAPVATSSAPVATSSAPVTTLAATTGLLTSTPPSTTRIPVTTAAVSSTIVLPSTGPGSAPVLKVLADPPAARFPGCGKRANLTASVSDASISGSITFDLVKTMDLPIGKSSSRQLGVATLSGGTATLMTSLFPVFPPGDHSIRATYTGPSTLKGGTAQVTYPVSKLCL